MMEPVVTLPKQVRAIIRAGGLVAINHSGGKDSDAMTIAILRAGIPKAQIVIVHAHLPDVEWHGTIAHIKKNTQGLPLVIARARKTFFEMVRHRGMFPSPQYRQCTSDLKRRPIERALRCYLKDNPGFGGRIISAMGMRAQESPRRAKQPTLRRSKTNSRAGREWYNWLPIHQFTTAEVFATIANAGQTPHWQPKGKPNSFHKTSRKPQETCLCSHNVLSSEHHIGRSRCCHHHHQSTRKSHCRQMTIISCPQRKNRSASHDPLRSAQASFCHGKSSKTDTACRAGSIATRTSDTISAHRPLMHTPHPNRWHSQNASHATNAVKSRTNASKTKHSCQNGSTAISDTKRGKRCNGREEPILKGFCNAANVSFGASPAAWHVMRGAPIDHRDT